MTSATSSNPSQNGSSPVLDPPSVMSKELHTMRLTYLGVVLTVGLYGNLYCIVKYLVQIYRRRTDDHGRSFAYFILAIAFTDILGLATTLDEWLRQIIRTNYLQHTNVTCKSVTAMGYIGMTACPWLILSLTCERYLVVRNPLNRRNLVSPSRTMALIGVVSIIAFTWNAWLLDATIAVLLVHTNTTICDFKATYVDYHSVSQALEMTVTATIPIGGISLLNLAIIRLLVRPRPELVTGGQTAIHLVNIHARTTKSAEETTRVQIFVQRLHRDAMRNMKARRRAAWRLLLASLCYFLFNLPTYLFRTLALFERAKAYLDRLPLSVPQVIYFSFVIQYAANAFTYAQVRHPWSLICCRKSTLHRLKQWRNGGHESSTQSRNHPLSTRPSEPNRSLSPINNTSRIVSSV